MAHARLGLLIPAFILSVMIASLGSFGCVGSTPDQRPEPIQTATLEPAAGRSTRSADGISPPFFRVEGRGGADLAILGTIHLGPSEGWKFAPTIREALASADGLILEIDLRALDEGRVGDLLAQLAILPVGTTLDQVVSPETWKLLEEQETSLAAIGFPRNARRHKKPWYLVMNIISLDSQKSGFDSAQSAEIAILSAAVEKPILGLETFESQLRLMDGLSPRIQDILLRDTLDRRDEAVSDIQDLVAAWSNNDHTALAEIALQGVEEFPELRDFYDALLKNRNRNWVTKLKTILDDPSRSGESIFVGVGALHLVGTDSVVELLRAEGYPVEIVHPPSSSASTNPH